MVNPSNQANQGLLTTVTERPIYLTLNGEINEDMVSRVFSNLNAAVNSGNTHAHIFMHSGGGGITHGLAIYNCLTNLPIEIVTYNGGMVSSIAVVIYLAGKSRKASETSQFMIHKSHWQSSTVALSSVEAQMLSQSLAANDARIEGVLRKHIELPDEKWQTHKHYDLLITPQEAREYGLSHEIADFRPPPGNKVFSI